MDGEWLPMPDQPNLQWREGGGREGGTRTGHLFNRRDRRTATVPTFGEGGDRPYVQVDTGQEVQRRPGLPASASLAGDWARATEQFDGLNGRTSGRTDGWTKKVFHSEIF